MKYIYVIEDDPKRCKGIIDNLRKTLRSKCVVKQLSPERDDADERQEHNYEKQLEQIFMSDIKNGVMIVCDKDLSGLQPRFIGLSGSTVCAVADKLGIPICLYARGENPEEGEEFLKTLAPWENKRIIIPYSDPKTTSDKCAELAKGFTFIANGYDELNNEQKTSPATALANILEKPEIEDKIALYGSGEQGILKDIMPFITKSKQDTNREMKRRMPKILGNWLYTSIMRFPGILLAPGAAASYLNIHVEDFERVMEHFKEAKYSGPFSKLGIWWWRHELDYILSKSKCNDGFELMKKKKIRARQCLDPLTKERAGYFCVITSQPVSYENSHGNISWFPSGADLTRIQNQKYNELAPWVGLY